MELQGSILSAYFYGYVATQFLGGYAANRWGGKHVVGLGVALTGVFALLSPEGARRGGPWTLFVLRVLQGMSSGVILPGLHVMFSLWFPAEERTSFSGAIFSGMHLGTVIGMSVSGPLTKWPLKGGGWPMVFYFFGAIGVFLYIPWCFLCYNSPEGHPRISREERDYIRNALGKENEFRKTLPIPWKHILSDIHVWSAIIYQWGAGIVMYTMLSDIPTYMKKVLNFDIQKLAFLSALPFLLTWISSSICGMLSQWLRTKGYLSHIMAYKIFNGVGLHVMFSLWFPAEERTSFSGAIFSGMHLGTVIGMSVSGPLTKWPLKGGGWPMVFYFFGAIGVFLYIPWCFLCYNSPEGHPRISREERDYIRNALGKENEFRKTLPIPWKHILSDIHVWSAIIYQWGAGIVMYTMLSDIPTYMKKVLNFDIQKLAFLSALPFLLTWISSSICGMLSQWLRTKGYLSHIMAYKIFNGVVCVPELILCSIFYSLPPLSTIPAALGPTMCLIVITLIGHQPDAIVILLATSGIFMGAFFGGSYVNHLDLALNYAGPVAGILHTVINTSGIIIPPTFAAIVKDDVRMRKN
ncbi:hypothetical protein J437_LFUL005403 [Ladona fulva]|uniref:Major facilitator superfamily (MFS) profile domain-containing protein n=1 Tax=Ladona fulva TaxID=123851 RepID=A0A8K0NY57_LADFU|nr:hypothetical protein J437_LFUL005403 [Ladona fulva]